MLCRACTGQGFTKRRLYTDEDSVIFQFQRCVGVNGIALSQLSPDFLDRCLTLTLQQIPSHQRKHEQELWKQFKMAKPRILGAILDTLSQAMKIYPQVEIERLPRMADFATWGEAISRALDHQPGEFLHAYRMKIGEQVAEVLEQNPIGLAILAFMQTQEAWEGAPGELLEILEDPQFVEEHKIDVEAEKWPGSAVWVTRRIKEIETNLEHEGVRFATKRVGGRRVITLTKREKNMSGNGEGDGKKGKDGISRTKQMTTQHPFLDVNVQQSNVDHQKVSGRNTVTTRIPSPCPTPDIS
ncbi:hypothetical protein GWN63_03965, partial [Candidatus Bathyarchaeota archaeon]|nr:hypothetical protein [Candidatus Bathyarchaeota archaeon]NIV68272.1 hypothetical protein [Candidatus Bathyarchaeota archaeon]